MKVMTGISIANLIASVHVKEDTVPPFVVLEGFVALELSPIMVIVRILPMMLFEE